MGKSETFYAFLYVLSILIVRLRRNKSPTGKFGYCICYILYILRHRRNDVDSIIIEELAYYCFSSHFFTHLIALICSLSLNSESSFVSFPSITAS